MATSTMVSSASHHLPYSGVSGRKPSCSGRRGGQRDTGTGTDAHAVSSSTADEKMQVCEFPEDCCEEEADKRAVLAKGENCDDWLPQHNVSTVSYKRPAKSAWKKSVTNTCERFVFWLVRTVH